MKKPYAEWFPLLRNRAGTNQKTADQAILLTPVVTGRKYLSLDLKTDGALFVGHSAYPSFRGVVL
jgi:hypothetical protein